MEEISELESRGSKVMMPSFDKLWKEFERSERENMELNSVKIKAECELECHKKKVDELDSHVTFSEEKIKMPIIMTNPGQVEDEDKKSNCVSIPSNISSTFYLPVELTIEILSRLPVKSLLRFSIVCKKWKSLIKSNNFISMHLKQYPLNPNLTCSSLVVASNWNENDNDKIYETCFHFESAFDTPVKFDFSYLGQRDYLMVIGVCDGLICISLSNKECNIVICNPATRQFKKIPPYEKRNGNCLKNGWEIYGFSLDPSANDYKLVRITCTNYKSSGEFVYQAEIYSMNSDVWRLIDINTSSFGSELESPVSFYPLVLVNGVFYRDTIKSPSEENIILSFDMNAGILQLVDTPQCCQSCHFYIIQLKEELAIIVNSNEERCFDVWLLNAATRCWHKKFKVELRAEIEFGDISFIGSKKNGDLVFKNAKDDGSGEIYSYDTTRKEINKLPFGHDRYFHNYCFMESLLSVKKNDSWVQIHSIVRKLFELFVIIDSA